MTISEQAALGGDTFSDVSQVIGKVAGGKITNGQVILASRDFLTLRNHGRRAGHRRLRSGPGCSP